MCGCSGNSNQSLWQQITDLTNQRSTLAVNVQKLEQENEQLRQQVKTLGNFDPNERTAAVDVINKITIGSRTGLYDKNGDKKKESLVLYLEPTDIAGDRIKAAGRLEVRLWNLQAEDPQKALLKQWTIEPEELKKSWSATLMTYCYRVVLGVEDVVSENQSALTVKVQFVDYFSGRILEDQRAIK